MRVRKKLWYKWGVILPIWAHHAGRNAFSVEELLNCQENPCSRILIKGYLVTGKYRDCFIWLFKSIWKRNVLYSLILTRLKSSIFMFNIYLLIYVYVLYSLILTRLKSSIFICYPNFLSSMNKTLKNLSII